MTRKQQIRQQCEELAKETVKKIGARAWYEEADKVLTPEEKEQVKRVWNTMPGHTCWMDAFFRWMNLGPNHKDDCTGQLLKYSGEGYNRVRVCQCGAEDHDPST